MSGPMVKRAQLELCIEDMAGLAAAKAGGADRVELCSALVVGGLTPSAGFMRQAAQSGIPAMALIRPRAGGFVYSDDEVEVMLDDIRIARDLELAGVVIGAAHPDGTLNLDVLRTLRDAAGDIDVSLHRVFDLTPDPFAAIDQAVELGLSRILTSGQQRSVPEGLKLLVELGAYANGRISIMPGGGITLRNVGEVIRSTGIIEIHSSCSVVRGEADAQLVRFGFSPDGPRKVFDPEAVAEMRRMLAVIATPGPNEVQPEPSSQAKGAAE